MLFLFIIYVSSYEMICNEFKNSCDGEFIPIQDTIDNINDALKKQGIDVEIPMMQTSLIKDFEYNLILYVNNYFIENDYNYKITTNTISTRYSNLTISSESIGLFYNGDISKIDLYYIRDDEQITKMVSLYAAFDTYNYKNYTVSEFLTHILKSLNLYHNRYNQDILDLINLYLEKDEYSNFYKFINIPIYINIKNIKLKNDRFISFVTRHKCENLNKCFGFTYKINNDNITFHNLIPLSNNDLVNIMKNFTNQKDKFRIIFHYTKGLDYNKLNTILQFINKNYDYRVKTCQIENDTKYINIDNCSKVINYEDGEDIKCEDVIDIQEIEVTKKYNPANVDIRIIGDTYMNNYLRQSLKQVKAFAIHELAPFNVTNYLPTLNDDYMYEYFDLGYRNYSILKESAKYKLQYSPRAVDIPTYKYCADIYDDVRNTNLYYSCLGTYYYCDDEKYTIIKFGNFDNKCVTNLYNITYDFKTCEVKESSNENSDDHKSSDYKSDDKPEQSSDIKPDDKSSDHKPDDKSEQSSSIKPDDKSSDHKPDDKPEQSSDIKPDDKSSSDHKSEQSSNNNESSNGTLSNIILIGILILLI